jgi:hypothetical protein
MLIGIGMLVLYPLNGANMDKVRTRVQALHREKGLRMTQEAEGE